MKRYLTPLLFFLCSQTLTAQIDTSKNYGDTTKKVIQISTSIVVVPDAKPQFKTDSSGMTIGNKVPNSMKPPMSTLSGRTTDAGKTASTLDVSGTGGAAFTVPFTLPPGLGNAVPQLALKYNSQGGVGIAGCGWDISGISSITRIPATHFHDNRVGGVNFDEHDRFALDGQRLVLKSGTYGADGAEYQTENYSNTKIISHGVSTFGPNYGPLYFEVFFADGSKAYYGLSQNSRSRLGYGVTYTENPLGARINYQYVLEGNTLYISQIGYGSLGAAAPINQVNFNYISTNRTEKFYIRGLPFYRNQLLSYITVVANGDYFRHYVPTYETMNLLNYQRIASLQELNGARTHDFDPIYFTYGATGDVVTSNVISNLSLSGIASNNSQVITSDFTGNGSMDFLLYPNSKDKFWAFYDMEPGSPYMQLGYEVNIGTFKEIFPATWLTHNNKILAGQGMIVVKNGPNGAYKFEMFSSGTVAPVYYQYEKAWNDVPRNPLYWADCDNVFLGGTPLKTDFISGDFNGDGLTDVIAINDGRIITASQRIDPHNPWSCEDVFGSTNSTAYFINMDRRLTSNYVTNLGILNQSYSGFQGDKLYAADFNGDGKTDILHIAVNKMLVYTVNNSNALELLWETSDSRITNTQLALMGDYNGDAKSDIMFSTGNNSLFATFVSTGNSFEKYQNYQPFSNTAGTWDGTPGVEKLDLYYLIPNDVDGDGKTDIISAHTLTRNNNSNGTAYITVYHNVASPGSNPGFVAGSPASRYTNLRHYPIPVFLNPDRPNHKLEFGFMSDNSVSLFRFSKDFRIEAQLNSVWQDGLYHQIEYKGLMPDQYTGNVPLYQTSYDQTYPFIDIQGIASMNVVSKLTRYFENEQVSQVFGYGKAVTHAGGLGFLGFGELIKSNWYVDDIDLNRMFSISVNSPGLRGATVKTFAAKTPYLNTAVKNANALVADTTLSVIISHAQVVVAANSIILLPGFEANGNNGDFIAKISDPAQGINDEGTLSDYVTRVDYAYNTQLLPNKVFVNIPISVSTKDLLKQTNSLECNEYDTYYNATKTTSNFGGAGYKRVEVTYANNPGADYIIGRLLSIRTILNNGTDSFTTSEEYSYTGYLITKIRRKGNNTPYTTENIAHDNYGNVIKNTIVEPGGAQRSFIRTYDITGRFIAQSTDEEGMTSSFLYNASTGTMQSRTNPFNQTDSFLYDTWGRLIGTTDFLDIKSTRSYQRDNNNIMITDTDDEGHSSLQVINSLGQKIETREKTMAGHYIGQFWRFDVYGRLVEQSEPGQPGYYNQRNQTAYDEYGRVKQISAYTGKLTDFSYNGLITNVNDGTKSVITTKNQLGQIVTLQDPGGLINYIYFANGDLKIANYGNVTLALEQDGYGRKTKLTDPSAGVYQYEYDGFGQLIKEITPKGITQYTYDATGKIQIKKISEDHANMEYTYAYDVTSKLLTSIDLSNSDGNNTTYRYTYDSNKRLSSRIESNLHAQFTRVYTYDTYGRIKTESYEAKNKLTNTAVEKTIEMHYQNGELLQTTLQSTGQVLWKINSIDEIGRLSTAMQGNSLKTNFGYDFFGFPKSRILDKISGTSTNLMDLEYNFDAKRGLLSNRSNSAFNWSESFNYDNLDRLISFNDNNGNNSQVYDELGRITSNALGSYSYYSNTYKQNELALSPLGNAYYEARALQQITYNAFKCPLEIIETGHDRISFQYNGELRRSHMYYGGEQADKMQRRYRRHYAEDGSMEITNDLHNGITSFVFYLGGDGYSAPAIWKEVHRSSVTQNLYYLHRDHLGSIIVVTDEQGNVVEKRQFDAWGNIVKLTDGNNNLLASFLIIDRGFTGHEHLLGVGLIHMNGRLYDPSLRRFLSPDNFVQDPYNTQNFNRFGYVMNNPLIFSDPSGEIIHLIIGAAIGGVVNWVAHGAKFNAKGLGYFGIGALSGVLGAGVASGIGATLSGGGTFFGGFANASLSVGSGFLTGAVVGASGGFSSGFTSGFGNALIGGSGFGSALRAGLRNGGIGGLAGGALGGISSGIHAARNGRNFWTGEGTSYSTEAAAILDDGMTSPSYSNESASEFSFSHSELRRLSANVNNLYADGTTLSGYSYNNNTGFFVNSQGEDILGLTKYKGIFKKTIDVYLSKAAFISRSQLYMTMHHEYMHAYFYANSIKVIDGGHNIIRSWHRAQLLNWAPHKLTFSSNYFNLLKSSDTSSFLKYGFKLINNLP